MATLVDTPTKSTLYLLETELQDDPLDTSFCVDGSDVLEDDFVIETDLKNLQLPEGYQPTNYRTKDRNLILLVQEKLEEDENDEEFVQPEDDEQEDDDMIDDE
jgi:hypothetical protein